MALLATVTKGKVSKPPIIMVHAKPGVGKSSWAAQAPDPLFVCLEEGANFLDVPKTPIIETWETIPSLLGELINEPHDFKTIVWDTLDIMEMLMFRNVCARENVKSIELAAGGFGKGYKLVLEDYWPLFIDGIRTLRDRRGVGSILLCHSVDREVQSAQTESYMRSEPKLFVSSNGKTDTTDYIVSQCDACGYFGFDVKTIESADKDRMLAKGGQKRLQHWYPAASHLAKNRFNIDAAIPLTQTTGFDDFLAARKEV